MTNEELVRLYQGGDRRALDKLIEQNKGIVFKIANKFYTEGTSSIDKEDLEQEGFIGLMIAVDKYKLDRENKAQFITYAVNWIYQKIHRYVTQKNTNDETSLDIPLNEDGDMKLQDTLQDTDYGFENIEEQLYLKQLRTDLEGAMERYNTLKEREILKLRYGWNTKIMTLEELGEIYKVAGNRVRDIQQGALRKLRNSTWLRCNRERFVQDGFIGNIKGTRRIIDVDKELDTRTKLKAILKRDEERIEELREKYKL